MLRRSLARPGHAVPQPVAGLLRKAVAGVGAAGPELALPSADVHARPARVLVRAPQDGLVADRRAGGRQPRVLVAVGSRRAGARTALACPDAAPEQLPVQRGAAQ